MMSGSAGMGRSAYHLTKSVMFLGTVTMDLMNETVLNHQVSPLSTPLVYFRYVSI